MADCEMIIKKCECCLDYYTGFGDCDKSNCEYSGTDTGCTFRLINDLLKLLKPRVLTLEEVEDALDTIVWVDRPQVENSSDEYALISSYSHKLGYVDLKFIDEGWGRFTYAWYGKTWRCWDRRPYDEERKAVKWDA